jgi:hypothetical protein
MSGVPNKQIEAWEEEGGAARRLYPTATFLSSTENQVEWGLRIKRRVNEEFDRVAAAFTVAAHRQNGRRRTETETIIAILEEKRLEVMRNEEAGYFIHGWQERREDAGRAEPLGDCVMVTERDEPGLAVYVPVDLGGHTTGAAANRWASVVYVLVEAILLVPNCC